MGHYNIPLVLLLVLTIKFGSCTDRIIKSTINPNCGSLCVTNSVTTVYIQAQGLDDTLHYIWDFTGKPSLLLAVTGPSADFQIDWEQFLWGKESSVKCTEIPKYTFGVVILKIYEFNDLNDTGLIDTVNTENINILHTKRFRWDQKAYLKNDKYVELSMEGTDYKSGDVTRNGSIKFLLNGFWTLEHSDIMPHMLHTANATQVDIVIDNFQTNSSFQNSRFAIELLIVGNHSLNSSMTIDMKKTLDDEHTPGIFEMVEITTPVCDVINGKESCSKREDGGYLQWRPVSYTSAERDVPSSTDAVYYPLKHVADHVQSASNSLLYSFYGYTIDRMLLQEVNVSLGSKGDGFYKKNNYSSWTFTIGYGTVPDEQFSFLVIMVISIGLGLPAIITVAAAFYMCVRRRYDSKDTLPHG